MVFPPANVERISNTLFNGKLNAFIGLSNKEEALSYGLRKIVTIIYIFFNAKTPVSHMGKCQCTTLGRKLK